MKNKIIYGILIFFLIISDFVYINAFISGGFIANDTGGGGYILLFIIINIVSLIVGFTKINKQKSIALILIILSLPTLILAVWMYTHGNDFNPSVNRMIKANLANARAQIQYNFDSNNSYSNACEDKIVAELLNKINEIEVKTKCFSDNDSFVLAAELKKKPKKDDRYYGYDYFCVDSAGSTESITTSRYQSIVNADTFCFEENNLIKEKQIPVGDTKYNTDQSELNSNSITYQNHGFTIELPKGFIPKEEQLTTGPIIRISMPVGSLGYVTDSSFWEKSTISSYTYVKDQKIGETTFKVYTYSGATFYWFKKGNVGYEFGGTNTVGLENLIKTFKFTGWVQN